MSPKNVRKCCIEREENCRGEEVDRANVGLEVEAVEVTLDGERRIRLSVMEKVKERHTAIVG